MVVARAQVPCHVASPHAGVAAPCRAKARSMLLQVVHCHPLTASYNHALFRVIVAALEESGHQVVATDLYREGFEPAMTAEERGSYFQPPYAVAGGAAPADLLRRGAVV